MEKLLEARELSLVGDGPRQPHAHPSSAPKDPALPPDLHGRDGPAELVDAREVQPQKGRRQHCGLGPRHGSCDVLGGGHLAEHRDDSDHLGRGEVRRVDARYCSWGTPDVERRSDFWKQIVFKAKSAPCVRDGVVDVVFYTVVDISWDPFVRCEAGYVEQALRPFTDVFDVVEIIREAVCCNDGLGSLSCSPQLIVVVLVDIFTRYRTNMNILQALARGAESDL